jgi:hypothetical protein
VDWPDGPRAPIRGYRFQGALALDRLIEREARQLVPSWWPQREAHTGLVIPFEGLALAA